MNEQQLRNIIREEVSSIKVDVESSHQSVAKSVSGFGSEIQKLNGIGRIPKFFKTDFGFLVAVLLFLVSILTPYYLIKIDIAVIFEKLNTTTEQIKDLSGDISVVNKDQHIISERVSKLEGIISRNAKTDISNLAD